MRPYIDFNTQKRAISNNEADKNVLKLMNNSVNGKTMENLSKRIKIKVVKNSQDLHVLIGKYLKQFSCNS